MALTTNAPCQNGEYDDGVTTQGGFSTAIRAHQRFVFPIPDEIESAHAASMLCAGLTVYSPLKTHGCGPGKKVGVVGIGGLGHYAVLWAKAMGAEVYAFTLEPEKIDDVKQMGADHVIDVRKKVVVLHVTRPIISTDISRTGFRETPSAYTRLDHLHGGHGQWLAAHERLSLHALGTRRFHHRRAA